LQSRAICRSGQHDDRELQAGEITAENFQEPNPVQLRHHQVQYHQIRMRRCEHRQRLVSIGRLDRAMPGVFQVTGENFRTVCIVIDNQDGSHNPNVQFAAMGGQCGSLPNIAGLNSSRHARSAHRLFSILRLLLAVIADIRKRVNTLRKKEP
jgi:hypothetical protein